MLRGLQNFIRA